MGWFEQFDINPKTTTTESMAAVRKQVKAALGIQPCEGAGQAATHSRTKQMIRMGSPCAPAHCICM